MATVKRDETMDPLEAKGGDPAMTWKKWTHEFSESTPHMLEMQMKTGAHSGYVQMHCFSTASMHMLAQLPGSAPPVLIACPSKCATNQKVMQLEKRFGAGVWETNGSYTDYSLVCLAAMNQTGVDGGLFLLQHLFDHDEQERSFKIMKTAHPFSLDPNNDGVVSEAEAEAAQVLFDGVEEAGDLGGGNLDPIREMDVLKLTAESAQAMDTNHDLVITQQEQLEWMPEQIRVEKIKRINAAMREEKARANKEAMGEL
jgi:hypothetical protein